MQANNSLVAEIVQPSDVMRKVKRAMGILPETVYLKVPEHLARTQ